MPLKGLHCQVSKLFDSDTRPHPTIGRPLGAGAAAAALVGLPRLRPGGRPATAAGRGDARRAGGAGGEAGGDAGERGAERNRGGRADHRAGQVRWPDILVPVIMALYDLSWRWHDPLP
jgi:hypothetical protein